MERRCDKCLAFKALEMGDGVFGQCRRLAPSVLPLKRPWPVVGAQDWCLEFVEREECKPTDSE